MELDKIEKLLDKYFEGETSIAEENELRSYFSSTDVAQHLEQYSPMFCYFTQSRQEKPARQIPLQSNKRNVAWLSVAASVVVMFGIGTFAYFHNHQQQDLGTYDDPEVALRETQKALSLLSGNVNKGMESVRYMQEFEEAKDKTLILR
ncbi:MAG TPA: hypothetical protein VGB50_08920 [Flavobacterium sp.]|jgi:hypothetical protein